ncbi:MAG: lipoate--protein ligase family protein, partial [Dehalococcoidia bacterium]
MSGGGSWRVLIDGGASGFRNMAVDEALLVSAQATAGSGWTHTLRLYWFEPAALSIGAFQPIADVDLAACAFAGIDVVRRPTGGRAVLHDGCMSYSLTGAADGAVFGGGIRASYRRIAAALAAAIEALGVVGVEAAIPAPGLRPTASCFDSATPYELLMAGK